ncbi:helix-turn-helix domain-containing protein [Streptomyces dubilierae]|uniref:Helix-turn-helix transcriptional regulator n=1 Tax=Streptomyces dubilierae TaxID=3075533 RepID=A0ABU2P7J2_9ACTN|nr:helix-turn-helix transcriptional regulator [Streptomyces sp. DSM 41921]MDT0387787.1 helix-turn-helix transcriptional regulator [Streptomyces sp. DSM 41921]
MPSDPLPDWVLTRRRQIGDNVRAVRSARGLTQEKLGELAGVDRKTVNRLEQGTHATNSDHLLLIAAALNTPLSELVK